MQILLIHTFAAFGIAFVIGYSKITYGIRVALDEGNGFSHWILSLMECPACLGFWIGFMTAQAKGLGWVISFAIGFYTAGTNFVIGRATGLIRD